MAYDKFPQALLQRLKTTSLVSFILFLLRVFTGKKCVAEAIMLNMDDTLDEEALIIFEELEVQNSLL